MESKRANPPSRQDRVVMWFAKDPEQFDIETYTGPVGVIFVLLLS